MRDAPIHDDSQREIEELREALRSRDALLSETSTALAEKDALIAEQQTQIARLERHVAIYEKLAFGKVAPSRPRPQVTDPRQGHLFAALLAEAEEVAKRERVEGTVELVEPGRAKKGKAKRRAEFPDHVPHFRSTYEIPESDQVCLCGAMLKKLGDDVTKELERLETTILHEIARAKYGCPRCGGAARTAPGPDRVIEKGLLGPGFLAHVMVERFLHHMPVSVR